MSKNLGKPKVVADVLEKGGRNVFQKLPDPLGRSFGYHRHFPKIFQDILILIVLIAFIALNTTLTSLAPVALSQESAAERQALEQELQRIEAEIDSYQNNIINLQAQAKTLNQSIQLLDAQINKLNLQIKATNLQLAKLDSQIDTLRVSVTKTQSSIDATQDMLVHALRQIYEEGQKSPLMVFLGENTLSDAFSAVNDLTSLESEIKRNLDELINLKANLVAQREDLASQRQEVLELKNIQEAQRKELEAKKKEKK